MGYFNPHSVLPISSRHAARRGMTTGSADMGLEAGAFRDTNKISKPQFLILDRDVFYGELS